MFRRKNISCVMFDKYTDLQSQFWSSYYPFFSSFETSKHSVQRADDNRKAILQALQSTLVLYIFKFVLYFNWIFISNRTMYYLPDTVWLSADTVWLLHGCFANLLFTMIACNWNSMYQELKEVNGWNVTVWSIMIKAD